MDEIQITIMFAVVLCDALFVGGGRSGFELYDYVHGVGVRFVLQLACELVLMRGGHTRQREYDDDERGFRFHRYVLFPGNQNASLPPKCRFIEVIETNGTAGRREALIQGQVGARDNLARAAADYFGVAA